MPIKKLPPAILDGVPDDLIMHTYPLYDLKDHQTNTRGICWCHPEIDDEGYGYNVVHKSMDGREAFERGLRKRS